MGDDFELAHSIKMCEVQACSRTAASKRLYLRRNEDCASITSELAELERQKQEAVEQEDFDRAVQLKQQQQDREANSSSAASEELQRVRREKHEAVEAEQFEIARELKKREQELEAQLRSEDVQGSTAALRLLDESAADHAVLRQKLDAGVAAFVKIDESSLWEGDLTPLQPTHL